MLPIEKTFKLDYKYKINKPNLDHLIESGYSRIPIYKENSNNLIGILKMKDLVGIDSLHPSSLDELNIHLTEAIHATENTYFLDLFEKFKEGKSRMAFIHKEFKDEKLLPDNEIEEEEKEKDKDNKNKVEIKEPLLDDIIKEEREDNKKEKINIKKTPVIGIVTFEDLIEFWLKIHIGDEENYEKEEKVTFVRRKSTL